MRGEKKIILCSSSPRRQHLLRGIGFDINVRTLNVDESFPDILTDKSIALYLAEKKANAFLKTTGTDEILITADTIVWLDERVLNKPSSKQEAIQMLSALSGRTHTVYTAVCLTDSVRKDIYYDVSLVTFRKAEPEEINYYVDKFNPLDKAGAYGAQECLPVGMNPCSTAEVDFLKRIGKTQLIEESINRTSGRQPVDMIKKIEGSYFNVMGLPVVSVYEHLQYYLHPK
jgi:septum formation protein